MKTNLKRFSKRSLALLLSVLMLFSATLVGTIFTANAADGVVYFIASGSAANNGTPCYQTAYLTSNFSWNTELIDTTDTYNGFKVYKTDVLSDNDNTHSINFHPKDGRGFTQGWKDSFEFGKAYDYASGNWIDYTPDGSSGGDTTEDLTVYFDNSATNYAANDLYAYYWTVENETDKKVYNTDQTAFKGPNTNGDVVAAGVSGNYLTFKIPNNAKYVAFARVNYMKIYGNLFDINNKPAIFAQYTYNNSEFTATEFDSTKLLFTPNSSKDDLNHHENDITKHTQYNNGSWSVYSVTPTVAPTTAPTVAPTTAPATQPSTAPTPYVYSAPTVTLAADKTNADSGDRINLTATATGIKVTHNGTTTDYKGNIVYKFYHKEDNGDDVLVDTITKTDTTVKQTILFDDTSTYYVVAYPSYDENAKGQAETTITNITKTNREKIKFYVDFDEVTLNSAAPTVTVTGYKGQNFTYSLTKLGESNIYYNDSVEVVYYTKSDGTVESGFKLVDITDGDAKVTVNNNQPELNKVLENKILWYKANTDTLTSNYSEEYYKIDESLSYTNDGDYQGHIASEKAFNAIHKRVYITDNTSEKGLTWSGIYASYTTDNKIWTSYAKMTYSGQNQHDQEYYFIDLPYDVKDLKFAGDKDGNQAIQAKLSDKLDYHIDDAYYFESSTEVKLWPEDDFPVTPIILQYNQDVYMAVGESVNITPSEHSASKKITYTDNDANIASVNTNGDFGASVTGVAKGTTTIKLTPYGTIGDNDKGDPATVTVHVVDKKELNKLIANGENAIKLKNSGKDYTEISYNGFLSEYAYALEVYNKSFNQTLIDSAVTRLANALKALHTAEIVGSGDEFDILAYNSSISQIVSADTTRGTVSKPTVSTNNYTKTIDKGYEVLYAAVDISISSTATQGSTAFSKWTVDGVEYSTDAALTLNPAPAGTTVYVANFAEPEVKLSIKYNFKDFDSETANTFEYVPDCTKPASYTTTLAVSKAIINDQTKLAEFVKSNAPKLESNYFHYTYKDGSVEKFTENADGTYSVEAAFTENMQRYHVYINGEALLKDDKTAYHYQELVTVDAAEIYESLINEENIYWYYVAEDGETEIPVSTDRKYEFRITGNLQLHVGVNDKNVKVNQTSVITHAYTEFLVDDNDSSQKNIHQNFYIQDFFDAVALAADGYENAKFVGAGVFFYIWNDSLNKPSKSAVKTSLNNLENYALELKDITTNDSGRAQGTDYEKTGLAYSYIDAAKDKGNIVRYVGINSCYNYFFGAIMDSNSAYAKYSYRVHSFYIFSYDNGNGTEYKAVVSKTYASAKVYQVK